MYVYLQAYEQAAKEIEPLVAAVSFYRGQEKAFETQPIEARDRVNNRVNAMPLDFEIPLDKLAPGKYDCQVTVLNPDGRKAAFWQARSCSCRRRNFTGSLNRPPADSGRINYHEPQELSSKHRRRCTGGRNPVRARRTGFPYDRHPGGRRLLRR